MEKIVKAGLRDCTVNLDGSECAVRFDSCFRAVAVRNDNAGDVFISKTAGIIPDADGVMCVKAGASTVYAHMDIYADTVYLLGKGKVQIHAQNDTVNPFNYAPAMDGGEKRGESSYTIENAVDYPVMGLNLYGKSLQDSVPTPENPVEIVSVGDSGSVAVTVDNGDSVSVTANITSAMPLCGIPVESGGNYTDSNGQQWAVDYVDFKKGVVVRNCRRVSFNGSEDWIVNSSASHSAGTDNRQRYRLALPEELKVLYDPNKYTADTPSRIICNKYPTVSSSQTWLNQTGIATSMTAGYIAVYDEERSTSISEWKTWLSANPMIIVYQLNAPVEIPLSESELQAYRQLQTYNGVTNISNDGGAEMSVGYCTNKMLSEYVMPITTGLQKQIDELKSAVLSLGGNI